MAAYLHDAGMVCSDDEKRRILQAPEWHEWISDGGSGQKRWLEVEAIRRNAALENSIVANFLADVQVRFLISEFVRARHNVRGREFLMQHQSVLGRFAFDDPILLRTIGDVCVAHGLDQKDLEDSERFPDQRDIRGDKVNVRFMSILFRLGDLLDMSWNRACPLLLNAACPLPADSFAHWTQYQRITHRNTAPSSIEVTARCESQAEHRVLRDWCDWIVSEVRNASIVMPHARRHSGWVPPRVTIDIQPEPRAKYVPSEWRIELDSALVIERLIQDTYEDPIVFIRELIQNSTDATRCRIYEVLSSQNRAWPLWPTDIDPKLREQYPITVDIEDRVSVNPLSGETQKKQVVIVEDNGVGMNEEIISRYLLQVGRSYYKSPEFRRRFNFDPTSRFGIGFLSVFAVSDEIFVETLSSGIGSTPIRLTLTGPRNYLITERGTRLKPGTRVEVVLRHPVATETMGERIESWCRRVEFPIRVSTSGLTKVISAEDPRQFLGSSQNAIDTSEMFEVKAFPITTPSTRGEIYVFSSITNGTARWDRRWYAVHRYPTLHPMANAPSVPASLRCQYGMALGSSYGSRAATWSARVDVRGRNAATALSRGQWRKDASTIVDGELEQELAKLVQAHIESYAFADELEESDYKQRLMEEFALPNFWGSSPRTVLVIDRHAQRLESIEEFKAHEAFVTVQRAVSYGSDLAVPTQSDLADACNAIRSSGTIGLTETHIARLSKYSRKSIFVGCIPTHLVFSPVGTVAIYWVRSESTAEILYPGRSSSQSPIFVVPMEGSEILGFSAHRSLDEVYGQSLINSNHQFAKWLCLAKRNSESTEIHITPEQFANVMQLLETPLRMGGFRAGDLERYLRPWRDPNVMPRFLVPPALSESCWLPRNVELFLRDPE